MTSQGTASIFRYWRLSTVLVLAGLLRILSIFLIRNYTHPYAWEFGEIAQVIYAGNGYTWLQDNGTRVPSAHMPPLYPYLLATMWRMFGQSHGAYIGLEVAQAILGVLLVFFVYRLASIVSSARVAMVSATVVAVWPPFVYICNEFHSISFYIVFGTAAVYYLVRFVELSQSWGDAIMLGLSMGGLLYCRAEAPFLLVCYVLIMVWRRGKAAAPKAFASFFVAALILSPWTIRTYRVFGHFVPVTTSAGFNLWVGHNRCASGNSEYSLQCLLPEQEATWHHETDGRRDAGVVGDRLFRGFAFDFIRQHPKAEVRLAARKLAFFILFDPTHKKGNHLGYWLPSLVLTGFGCYGIWIRRSGLLCRYFPLMLTIFYSILLAGAVFSVPRYRIVIDPFVAIFAADATVSLASGRSRENLHLT